MLTGEEKKDPRDLLWCLECGKNAACAEINCRKGETAEGSSMHEPVLQKSSIFR